MFIQLDDGKTDAFANPAGNGRFSSSASAKNNKALHRHILMPAPDAPRVNVRFTLSASSWQTRR
jgi:hypothetical protein